MISKRIFLALAVAALLTVSSAGVLAQSSESGPDTTQQIQGASGGILDVLEQNKQAQIKAFIGSWEGVLTPEAGGPPPFLIQFTFGTDGTVVVSDAGPPGPQFAPSSHGAWERIGDNEFTIIYKQFLFTSTGDLDSTFKGRVKFKLNQSTLEINGVVKVDLFAPNGAPIIKGEGTIKCTKIRIESLD